jgi:hypothetical protein
VGWLGDGADRHPRDVARWLPCSVCKRSSEQLRASALRRDPRALRQCPSPTPTCPPGLGSSSSVYVIMSLIFNVCMHFKQMWRWTFVCVQADYMVDGADDPTPDRFL